MAGRGRGATPAAIAMWIAATGVAVAAAGGAVRVVTNQVLEPLPPPTITSTETDVIATQDTPTDAPTATPSEVPSDAESDGATAQASPSPSRSTAPVTTPSPSQTASPSSSPVATSSPTEDASETDRATDAATDDHASDGPTEDDHASDRPTEDDHASDGPTDDATDHASEDDSDRPSDADPVVRTVTSEGGSASFEWADGHVRLRWATPGEGFRVSVQEEPGEVTVEFVSATHESRIKADWEDGQPRVRVEERPRDGDDHRD